MRPLILVAITFALFGAVLIGDGITGMVISQSCCFGPQCLPEYRCDAAEPVLESPSPFWNGIVLGGGMLLVAALVLIAAHRLHHRRHKA